MAIDYLNTQGLQEFWDAVREFYSESLTKKVDEATQADHLAKVMTLALEGGDGVISGRVSFDGSQDVVLIATVEDVSDALHGLMTPEQKLKLDGIEPGGQVNILEGVKVIIAHGSDPVKLPIDENKDVTLDLSTYALYSDVTTEQARAETREGELHTEIDTERRSRESADIQLQSDINTEITNRTEADDILANRITSEQTARISGDDSINNRINNLNYSAGEEGKFVSGISQSAGAVSSTLTSFVDDISAEGAEDSLIAPQTKAVKTYVDTEVGIEASYRQLADEGIRQDLTEEISNRSSADATLQSNIDTEEAARISADNTLQSNINTEAASRSQADAAINARIDNLDYTDAGAANSFIYSIKQEDGAVSVTKSTFISDIRASSESTTAPQTVAIKTYVDEEIENASSDIEEKLNQEIQDRQDADTSINTRIDNLDYSEPGEDGKFLYGVSQADGKISSSLSSFIDDISTVAGGASTTAPQSAAVRSYVDSELSNEAAIRSAADTTLQNNLNAETTARTAADTSLNKRIDDLNFNEIGADGKFVYSIQQLNGLISSTLSSFIDDISTTPGGASTTAPQSAAVRSYVDAEKTRAQAAESTLSSRIDEIVRPETGTIDTRIAVETQNRISGDNAINQRIDNLDLNSVGSLGSFISTVGQSNGQLSAAKTAFVTDVANNGTSQVAPTTQAIKNYTDTAISNETTARETADTTLQSNIDAEATTRETADTSINERINSMVFSEIGEDGKFVYSISQMAGTINSTLESFADDLSTTNAGTLKVAPQTKAVKAYVDAEKTRAQTAEAALGTRIDNLDLSPVGSYGSFISEVRQANGLVGATFTPFISDIENNSSSEIAPQTSAIKTYVDDAVSGASSDLEEKLDQEIQDRQAADTAIEDTIKALDLDPVGTTGSFISSVSQANGQLSASAIPFISDVANNGTSTVAPQTAAVKSYTDTAVTDEATARSNADSALRTDLNKEIQDRQDAINALDFSEIGSAGNFIYSIKQEDGKVVATASSFISDISTTAGGASTTAPQSAAVKTYVDNTIASLDVTEVGSNGNFILKIKEDDGKITATTSAFISDISTTPGSVSTTAPQSIAVKTYVDDEVSAEAASRVSGDSALQDNIDAEAALRSAADTTLQANINAESTSRQTADNTLSGRIDTEITNRQEADTSLSNRIDAITEEGTGIIDTRIAAEASTRETADTSLANSISSEASARATADTSLATDISKRVVGLASGSTENHILVFGSDGYHIKDSGHTIQTSVPANAVFTDTTYSASDGVTLTGTNFTNSGVRSVTASTSAGYINVNTNGTTAGVHINADIAAGVGISVSTSSTKVITNTGVRSVIQSTEPGHILVDTNGTTSDLYIAPPLTAGPGINTDNNIITNTGVRAIADSTTNGAIEVNTNGTTSVITVYEHYSSTASGSYGNSTSQTPGYGSTFNVPYITVNAEGHITAAANTTVKIPAAQTSLPTQYGITIQTNGTTQISDWKGGSTTSVNITYQNVGAASAGHTHSQYISTVGSAGSGDIVTAISSSGNNLTYTLGKSTTGNITDSTAIPTAAAVRSFVNSTVTSMAAFYITKDAAGDAFATKAELNAAIASGIYYSGGHIATPSNNDYCMVLEDETHDNATCRYMYVIPEGQTTGAWSFQYKVNTSFTAAQQAAINSGIDSTLTAQITTNASNISNLSSNKADKATTLAGYGITDAKIDNGVITLGSNTITPLTAHPSISTTASTSSVAPGFGSTFSAVSSITKDSNGHITNIVTDTVTIPSSTATTAVNGLMTTAQVTKLEGIEANANKYTHPNITASGTTSAATPGFGSTFTALDSVTVNSNGHVTAFNTKTVTVPSSTATTTANGLMTTAQVTKLNGIAENANNYTHPSITATSTSTTAAPGYGGTFTAIDSVTVNNNGHVTAFNTKTVTLPASDNTDTYPSGISVSSTSGSNAPAITVTRAGTTTTSISGNIPLATASVNGVVSTTAQTFAGDKTFNGSIIVGGHAKLAFSTSGSDNILTVSFI